MSDESDKGWSKALEVAADLASKLFGSAFDVAGQALAQQVALWTWQNGQRIAERVNKIIQKRQLEGKTVLPPPGLAVSIMQAAPLEDDPTVQELWAELIVNALDPARTSDVTKTAVRILAELEPLDAQILESLAKRYWGTVPNMGRVEWVTLEGLAKQFPTPETNQTDSDWRVRVSLHNLYRLGLVADESPLMAGAEITSTGFLTNSDARIIVTSLGRAIWNACSDEGYD